MKIFSDRSERHEGVGRRKLRVGGRSLQEERPNYSLPDGRTGEIVIHIICTYVRVHNNTLSAQNNARYV